MSVFDDVTFIWKGEEYIVPSDKVMGLIATVEQHVKAHELSAEDYRSVGEGRLSMAYSAALVYAGAKVNAEDVYLACFDPESAKMRVDILTGLMLMFVPPSLYRPKESASKKKQSPKTSGK